MQTDGKGIKHTNFRGQGTHPKHPQFFSCTIAMICEVHFQVTSQD